MARLGTVLAAMVTPFDDEGALDPKAAAELARWLVEHGVDGLVLAGTTGESPTLDDDEKLELFATVRGAVDVPLVAGTGSNDTRHSVELTRRATEAGVDGILAVTPYYNRPSQAGIADHFRSIAAATDLPVVIYDIPFRTGRKVESEVLVRLASEVDNIAGLKDAAGDPGETARVLAEAPDDFELYSGEDSLTLPLLAVGAVGVVGVAAHWSGRQHREMIDAYRAGDVERARRINESLLESFAYETGPDAPNPVPTKVMMRVLGLSVGTCRPPLGPEPDGLEAAAEAVLANLDRA